MVAFGLTAALRPHDGLLLFAALGPLSTVLFMLAAPSGWGYECAETLAIALIGGWAGGHAVRPRPLAVSGALRWTALVLAATALGWAVVEMAGWVAQHPQAPIGQVLANSLHDYLSGPTPQPARPALLWMEGVLLVLATADSCGANERTRDAVLRMMVLGATAAALLNAARYAQVVMAQEHPWEALLVFLAHMRVNTQYADLNAAGSYFAMMAIAAGGFVTRRRWWAILAPAIIGFAVWLSGSRFALGGVLLAAALAVVLALKGRGRRVLVPVVVGIVLIGGVTAVGWKAYPTGRNFLASKALNIRLGLARGGLHMAADHPVFGVGPGHFYELSNRYAAEAIVPFGYTHENAHNNYVQVLAELGIPGLALFVLLVSLALREAWRSAPRLSPTTIALLGGLAAYLITCVGGHPLLVPDAAYPFWIALGLAAVPLGRPPAPLGRVLRYAAAAAMVVVVASLPWRARAVVRAADMEHVSSGLSGWEHDATGRSFRIAGIRSSFYVPVGASVVRIPLKNVAPGERALEVRLFVEGREADRVLLPPDGQWYEKRWVLNRDANRAYLRIDLEVGFPGGATGGDETAGRDLIMVGRPILEWGR
jgi:O-antigen ligase